MNRNNAGNPRNYDFSRVPEAYIPRTRMYRPSTHKTCMNPDYLYPLFCDEVLPGDTFKLDVSSFGRMTTARVPFMDNVYLDWQFFFVPSRLVWSNWQRFCGEQDDPDDSIDYTVPYMKNAYRASSTTERAGFPALSIYDYFGLPVGKKFTDHDVMSLPMRAYNLIWNEWYRDENLQDSLTVQKGDGPDYLDDYSLQKRGKRKDYFTSCLPQPQKGPEVLLPISSSTRAPVYGNGQTLPFSGGTTNSHVGIEISTDSTGAIRVNKNAFDMAYGDKPAFAAPSGTKALGIATKAQGVSGAYADLSDLTSVSINELRQAFQLQKFFERLNRGGTRYIEILKGMFGVTSPDARLQRPELLGAFTVPLQLFQNTQTSASESGGTPQGTLAATGTIAGRHFAFNKSFVEHGYILGLASIRSDLSYQQGLHRMWSRSTRYSFYWPTFAHLGEQDVKNKELYFQDYDVVDSDTGKAENELPFGYQERWAEYKYGQNRITGELRSSYSQSLDVWHLSQNFTSLPTLSPTFIESSTPISRVLAYSTEVAPAFVVDVAFDLVCARALPLYDVPGLVDHF